MMFSDAATVTPPQSHGIARGRARALWAGGASLLLHLGLLAVLFGQSRPSGDLGFSPADAQPILLVDWVQDRERIRDARATLDNTAPPSLVTEPQIAQTELADPSLPELADTTPDAEAEPERPADPAEEAPPGGAGDASEHEVASALASAPLMTTLPTQEATFPASRKTAMDAEQQAMLEQRIEMIASTLQDGTRSELAWQQDGQAYRAVLTRNAPQNSMDLERVHVDVTTMNENGASLHTSLTMKRLAFSHFTQMVDRWDANVQMHDDEIIGRFHSNSSFHIAYDSKVAPQISGKVTTAARNVRMANLGSRRQRDDMFRGGFETSTGRIALPNEAQPFAIAPPDRDSFVHTFPDDVHLTLYGDGRYTWQARRADNPEAGAYPANVPSYFIAARGATIYVKGVVNGRVLIYSPERIVIEGALKYAADPRASRGADDYLGLVSDRYVEIARPYVTGRGDLEIEAAIFARRRFIVSDIDYPHTATLSIYGSLTAGTLSASEPRYATRMEFDPRLDQVRPPGFPTTNRFEVSDWDASWNEMLTEDSQ